MTLYEKNMSFIKKQEPDLYNIIIGKAIYEVKLEKVKDQINYIMEYNDSRCFIHSIYDINEEMRMIFNKVDKEVDLLVLFGLGCGYAIDYIYDNFKKLNRLIIIEPSLYMFNKFLEYNDIYKTFKNFRNLTLIINQKEQLTSMIIYEHVLICNKVELVSNLSYRTLFQSQYEIITSELVKQIRLKRGNISVTDYSWAYWLINSVRNLKENNLRVENIKEIFKDKPIVIVSAGPSLNKNMQLLNEIKDKAIIIAVGTAIKILDNNNIQPHFRAAYDGTPQQKLIFENLNDNNIPFIYGSKLYYDILPNYKGDKFSMIIVNDSFNRYVYDRNNISYIPVETGASIANVIVNLMCEFLCSKVIFVGQDLCYTDKSIYAKGSEKEVSIDFNKDEYVKCEDINGNTVYTSNVFLNMKYGFEFCVEKYKNIKFINATEGGISIEGTEVKKLDEVIKEELSRDINFSLYEILKNIDKNKVLDEFRLMLDSEFKNLYQDIQEIIKMNEERLKLLIKLRKDIGKKFSTNRLMNDLKYIEKFEKKLKKIPFYKEVIAIELGEVLNTLRLSFEYKGKNTMKQIKSVENILTNICIQVQKFAMYTKELIEEHILEKIDS